MIAKLVFYGKDRLAAIEGLKKAISDYRIEGIKTTLDFGTFVMNHPAFISGNFTTNFVKEYFNADKLKEAENNVFPAAAELLKHLKNEKSKAIVINN
jgi:acetyl/propionyl-CoA carboxylase alpha subunit